MAVDLWPPGKSASANRFAREVWVAVALYVGLIGIGAFVWLRLGLPQWSAILLVVGTMAYSLLMLRAVVRLFSSLDEMQRRMQSEALLITAGVVGFGSFAYSFLEIMRVVPTLPHAMFFVLPIMILVWRVAFLFVARRYK
ncbi:MAG TPA: hypothetical protein VG943_01215 [Caulobacterales bacterium]|nr:hypothetical protein [Caulobacterales bacterium]